VGALTVLLDTAAVAPRDAFDFWSTSSSEVFYPMEIHREIREPFRGRVEGHSLGPIDAYRIVADGADVRRTAGLVAASDPERLDVAVQVRGTSLVAQDGRETWIGPGDIAAYQSSRPFRVLGDDPVEMAIFSLPRGVLGARAELMCRHTAQRFAAGDGLTAVAAPFLVSLLGRLDAGVVATGHADMADGVLGVVRALFTERIGADATLGQPPAAMLLSGVKRFIELHLGEPWLGPEAIARANHISTRYLHKIFESEHTSVSEWIRDRRLERCRRDLLDPALRHETILSIATRWGITSSAHFSRVYRAAYGRTPREERRAALSGAA
jgi:AraC-like DNA-binding protein